MTLCGDRFGGLLFYTVQTVVFLRLWGYDTQVEHWVIDILWVSKLGITQTLKKRIKANWLSFGDFIREEANLIGKSWKQILTFILLYTFIGALVRNLVGDTMKWCLEKIIGTTYIGPENLISAITSFRAILLLPVFGIIISFISIMEIEALIYGFSMARMGVKPTITGMMAASLYACKKSAYPRNWLIIFYVVLLLPFTKVLSLSNASSLLEIPGFVEQYISDNEIYNLIYTAIYIFFVVVEFKCIFALNCFVLEDIDFISACKKSLKLIRGNFIKTVSILGILYVVVHIVIVSISSVVSANFQDLIRLVLGSNGSLSEAYRLANTIYLVKRFFAAVAYPMTNIAALTTLYYVYMKEARIKTERPKVFNESTPSVRQKLIAAVIILSAGIYGLMEVRPYLGSMTAKPHEPGIVAHRGDSVVAPENTMPAFELALAEEPEWVEFDVHETKDGVMIVSHDDNLKRVTGKKVYVHELTYEELEKLDCGSWFSDEYAGLKFSTFDEVLKTFKDSNIRLQVEIKPTKYDHELEEKVLKIINDNGMHDRCIITSLKAAPLKRIKELDPTMITAYSMYIAWDHIEDITWSDYFTIEESNVTPELVADIHKAGKKCFAWTVNSEETVQNLVDSNVDGILTDDPQMMWNALDKADYTGGIRKFMNILADRLVEGY